MIECLESIFIPFKTTLNFALLTKRGVMMWHCLKTLVCGSFKSAAGLVIFTKLAVNQACAARNELEGGTRDSVKVNCLVETNEKGLA